MPRKSTPSGTPPAVLVAIAVVGFAVALVGTRTVTAELARERREQAAEETRRSALERPSLGLMLFSMKNRSLEELREAAGYLAPQSPAGSNGSTVDTWDPAGLLGALEKTLPETSELNLDPPPLVEGVLASCQKAEGLDNEANRLAEAAKSPLSKADSGKFEEIKDQLPRLAAELSSINRDKIDDEINKWEADALDRLNQETSPSPDP